MKKSLLLFLSTLITATLFAQTYCGTSRYDKQIFPNVTVTSNVVFGWNYPVNSTTLDTLKMDVYQPSGDTASARPLIVFAHGGSFIGGDKTDLDEDTLATRFAKRGYVTTSINYRLGMGYPPNQTNATDAVWRAVQDMKAAVRFFRKDAHTTNLYKIDTNFIFVGGYSAGAFIAVHYAYLNESSKIPSYVDTTTLGGLEGNSGNAGYSTRINAVLNFAGAIGDTTWITNGEVPMITCQGNVDNTVPYCTAMIKVSGFPIEVVNGGGSMNIRCKNVGLNNPIHTYYGEDHCASVGSSGCPSANMDTTVALASDFLYRYFGCTPTDTTDYTNIPTCVQGAGVNEIVLNSENVLLYPNPAVGNLLLTLKDVKGKSFSGEIHDIIGRKISRFNFSDKNYYIQRNKIESGIYFLKITSDANEVFVSKIIFTE